MLLRLCEDRTNKCKLPSSGKLITSTEVSGFTKANVRIQKLPYKSEVSGLKDSVRKNPRT